MTMSPGSLPLAKAEAGRRILETERLALREFTTDDAEFVCALLNEPGFLRFIGDRRVRTTDEARAYIETALVSSYARHGYGPYRVLLRPAAEPLGLCGLFRKDWLDAPDLGYAFLARHASRGYAVEAARAVMAYAGERLGLKRVVAVATPDNEASIRLLGKLGFEAAGTVLVPDTQDTLCQFATGPGWPTKGSANVSYG